MIEESMKIVDKGLDIKNWRGTFHCSECLASLQVDCNDLKVGFRFVEKQKKVNLYCREYYIFCANCKSTIIVESENLVGKENKLSLTLKKFVDNRKHSCKPIEY